MARILNVVGCKNSGKTRTIELLVPVLKDLGLQAGTLKHTQHDGFNWDVSGKDTFRHFEAGSAVTGIFGTSSFAFNLNAEGLHSPLVDDLVRVFYREVDLVIIEGLKSEPGLKVEVCRPDYSDREVVPDIELLAIYGADLFKRDVPHFDYGHERELGRYIVDNLSRLRTVDSQQN